MKSKFEEIKNSPERTECFFGTIEEYEKLIKSKDPDIKTTLRYATKEEQVSIDNYINKISTKNHNIFHHLSTFN